MALQAWEQINDDVERLMVPGGWLYRVRSGYHYDKVKVPMQVIFVEDAGVLDKLAKYGK